MVTLKTRYIACYVNLKAESQHRQSIYTGKAGSGRLKTSLVFMNSLDYLHVFVALVTR